MTPSFTLSVSLAGALLRRAPADAVREPADIRDLLSLYPTAFFGYGRRTVLGAFGYARHLFQFFGIPAYGLSSLIQVVKRFR